MLNNEQIEKNFEEYISLLLSTKREGIEKLVDWLKSKDTKVAPASSKYHSAYAGGLVEHSLKVYKRLKDLINVVYPKTVSDGVETKEVDNYVQKYSDETLIIVALLHDISKVNYYDIQYRNVRENEIWVQKPFYAIKNDEFIYGTHGLNSLYIAKTFVKLGYEEELAILHHMGGFDYTDGVQENKLIPKIYGKSPLALLLHEADLMSTFLDENRE